MTDDTKSEDIPREDVPREDIPRGELLLEGLPSLDITPARAEQLRRRAHAILRAEQASPPVGSFAHRYQRTIEPVLLIGLAGWQMLWAVHGTWQLFQ
jgi:hypothetical protein